MAAFEVSRIDVHAGKLSRAAAVDTPVDTSIYCFRLLRR